ncbi:MAG: hypothetical protein E6I60_06070 [Chloroflexi bacterium]|nr:MAG: hypothetical protein E6I60_06070 [Chloroflexota bacterium]
MAVALLDPLSRLDPPHRPDWRSELTTAQFGPMAEDLLAVCIEAAGSGSATIARPIVDRGIDLYVRRLRSLLTIPIQVKAFQHLSPDGNGNLDLPVADVAEDPNGYLAMVHVPAPYDQLYRRLFLIPFREFRERCPRALLHGRECFSFTGNFSTTSHDLWSDHFFDIDRLPEWLASAPGWATPIPPVPHPPRPHDVSEGDGLTQWRGDIGRLWTATELERAGAASIVLAQDRVRLDTVTLLIDDLSSRRIAGLHVRTGKITPGRTVHFEVPRPPFFIDQRLYVLLVLLQRDDRVHDFCLLMPSDALPGLGYSETITLDPLTKRFVQYRVPSDEVGSVFLKSVFGG